MPSANSLWARDRFLPRLRLHAKLDPYRFEMFTAGLLQAMGYRAEVTPASGDGGVIAYRDPLGLEPPIPKVQCKRTLNTIGGPDVQKLMGTLAPGSTEVGLSITLDTFTSDTISLARSRHDLRLVNGRQLVDMTFDHYEQLDLEWRRLLPLKRIYVLDHEPDAGWGPTGSRSVAHGGRHRPEPTGSQSGGDLHRTDQGIPARGVEASAEASALPYSAWLRRSGDLDGVLELGGDLLGERDDEVAVKGGGHSGEGVDAVARSPAFLETGDHRLGGAHPLGELALAEAGLSAQVVDELPEREVLLDPGAGLDVDGGALLLDLVPAGVVGHGGLLHGYRFAHAVAALRARVISLRSLLRCLRNVVSRMIRPSLVNR